MADNDMVRIKRPVEWLAIPGFEGRYSITRDGCVWSHGGRTHKTPHWMKSVSVSTGYRAIRLHNKQFYIHRLVMMTWGPQKPTTEHEINHRDGDKTNNHIANLEWVTRSQNAYHAIFNGLTKHWSKLTEIDVIEIRRRHANGEKQIRLADEYNVHFSTISVIIKRLRWRHL